MEENNNKQIKWEVILTIPEFANLLNISTLKELSLLSKLFRLKSLSKLFKIIQLDEKVFPLFLNSSKNNLICEYFGSRNCSVRYGEDGGMDKNFRSEENTDMSAESTVKEIELKLEKYKHHVKSFKLAYSKSTGYYLLPISNIFLNLTSLKIVYSVVSFKIFNELLSNLTKLNFLELNNASLAVLPTQEQSLKNFKFPQNLEKLVIYGSNFTKTVEHQNVFDLLFKKSEDEILAEVMPPPMHIASLKNFDYYGYDSDDDGLNRFLENNNQLEYLGLNSNIIDSQKLELISKFDKFKKLSIYCLDEVPDSLDFPTLNSITKLQFISVNQVYLPTVETLCMSCAKLNELSIIFEEIIYESISQMLSTLITRIIPKLTNLRSLNLFLFGNYRFVINLNELNNVTKVRIQANLDTTYNLDFANNEKLNKFEFYWNDSVFDHDIKTKFDSYKDWRFIYSERLIKGRRIINKN